MIVKKLWVDFSSKKCHMNKYVEMRGWFLFGFIPLYIDQVRTIN